MRSTKDCAIRSGFNHTVEMQKLCRCISTNGIKSVNNIFAKSKWAISTCNGTWGEENCTKKSCNQRLKFVHIVFVKMGSGEKGGIGSFKNGGVGK
jgi:hypothetical protein